MGTDRSRLQMQLRRQEVEVHAIEEEYASRMHRMQREHKRRRFNQKRTQMAEKVKVHKKVRVQVQRKYDPSVIALQEHQAKLRQRLAEKMLARDDGKSAFSFASRAKGDCYDHSVKDEDYSWRAPDVAGLDNSDVLFDEHVRKQRAKVAEQRRGLSTAEQSLGGFSSAPQELARQPRLGGRPPRRPSRAAARGGARDVERRRRRRRAERAAAVALRAGRPSSNQSSSGSDATARRPRRRPRRRRRTRASRRA